MSATGHPWLLAMRARRRISHEEGAHAEQSITDDKRPDPEELLDRYGLRDERQQAAPQAGSEISMDSHRPARGRLRVYLGMAAGVGKTYAMLNEGRRRKERGS